MSYRTEGLKGLTAEVSGCLGRTQLAPGQWQHRGKTLSQAAGTAERQLLHEAGGFPSAGLTARGRGRQKTHNPKN